MEISSYCSDLFKNKILPSFLLRLKSSVTAETYQRAVNSICDYWKKDFLEIDTLEAQEFFNHLLSGGGSKSGRPLAKKTINMRYGCIRSLSSYIQTNQELFNIEYRSPFLYLDLLEPDQNISSEDILTSVEIDNLLKAATEPQMYLMVSLVLTCGLSVKEIIELKPNQLVLDEKNRLSISFLKANGREYRYVKVPESLKEALLTHAESVKNPSGTVFTNKQGQPLTRRVLELHVKALMEEAGLKGWTMRDLRNTASFYMLSGGASVSQTATQLGICERWIYRFNKVVEEMDVQASDLSCIQIRAPKETKIEESEK